MLKNTPSPVTFTATSDPEGVSILKDLLDRPRSATPEDAALVRDTLQESVERLEMENRKLRERIASLNRIIESLTPEVDEVVDICAVCGSAICNHPERLYLRASRLGARR